MREIKFRTWDTAGKFFEYFDLHEIPHGCATCPYTAQQFTGIKDKNGKEIYEGDLLARPLYHLPVYFEVYWNKPAARFNTRLHRHHNKMIATYPIVADDYCNHEVVGNIFENPELLKHSKYEQRAKISSLVPAS